MWDSTDPFSEGGPAAFVGSAHHLSSVGVKIAVAIVLFMIGGISALAPRWVAAHNHTNLLSYGNMLASGVLLGAGLLHTLPDAVEGLHGITGNRFPLAFFICGCSFGFFLTIEEFIHIYLNRGHCLTENDGNGPSDGCEHGHSHRHSSHTDSTGIDSESLLRTSSGSHQEENHDHHDHEQHEHGHQGHLEGNGDVGQVGKDAHDIFDRIHGNQSSEHHHVRHIQQHLHGSVISSIALFIALSTHSILAGFSIGVVDSQDMISIVIAVFAHKMFAAYAFGSTLVACGDRLSRPRSMVMIGLFASSTPAGIIIAILCLTVEGSFLTDGVTTNVIQAMLAGVFLYISIIEVGMKELLVCRGDSSMLNSGEKVEILKLFSLLSGYAGMAVLSLYV